MSYSYDRRVAAKSPSREQLQLLQMLFPPKKVDGAVPLDSDDLDRLSNIPNWVKIRGDKASLTPWGKQNLWVR